MSEVTTRPEEQHDEPPENEPPESRLRAAVEWVVILGGALVVALVVKTFLLQAFYIPSRSMVPTLNVDDRVLVNKLSYDLHEVNRGDVVVFHTPPGEQGEGVKDLIKRIIALPGETVHAQDGRVVIDGRVLREPYLAPSVTTGSMEPRKVPPGHYWVMGDNRADSRDSRYFGPVPESVIVGRAFVRVWPITSFDLL